MKKQILNILWLILLNPLAAQADLEGLLFVPKVFAHDIETDPENDRIQIPVLQQPSKTSPPIASITRAGIKNLAGQPLYVPEFRYEEKALPVIEHKGGWYKVGLQSSQTMGEFPEKFALIGWVNLENAEFQTISEFLEQSMISLNDWDEMLYKSPETKEKFKVIFPRIKILGTARLKPENLVKTSVPCEIPFYADSNKQKLIGICPQNFSFIHGAECEGPKDSTNIFCLKVYVLGEANGLYNIAFKNDLILFRKNQLNMNLLKKDPDFGFYTGWVEKTQFDSLKPLKAEESKAAQAAITGQNLNEHKDVQVQERKTVQGQDWLRVKIIDHCGEEKSYGEGWLPVRLNKKINFNFISRGC